MDDDPKPAEDAKAKQPAFMPNTLRLKRAGISKAPVKPKIPRPASEEPAEPASRAATPPVSQAKMVPKRLPTGECRSVDCYARLNLIAESQHGIVYRARNKATGSIVALKKFKNRKDPDGFPITFLREISILFTLQHPNIITADEVVTGGSEEDLHWFVVLEYVDHDLKDLITAMKRPFLEGQVKHFMHQTLMGICAMHESWLIHRDLKTTNLLVNYRGVLKVCDFGMARHCGSPYRPYTDEVISRWYRPPEILIGKPTYGAAVDMWSIGCIFGELLQRGVCIPGESELDQLSRMFKLCGTPTEESWPEYATYAQKKGLKYPLQSSAIRQKFPKLGYDPTYVHGEQCKTTSLSNEGADLLELLLTCNPDHRVTAADALEHPFFEVEPASESLTPENLAQLKKDLGDAKAAAKKEAAAKAMAAKIQQQVPQTGFSGIGGFGMVQPQFGAVNPMAAQLNAQLLAARGVAALGLTFQKPPGT